MSKSLINITKKNLDEHFHLIGYLPNAFCFSHVYFEDFTERELLDLCRRAYGLLVAKCIAEKNDQIIVYSRNIMNDTTSVVIVSYINLYCVKFMQSELETIYIKLKGAEKNLRKTITISFNEENCRYHMYRFNVKAEYFDKLVIDKVQYATIY